MVVKPEYTLHTVRHHLPEMLQTRPRTVWWDVPGQSADDRVRPQILIFQLPWRNCHCSCILPAVSRLTDLLLRFSVLRFQLCLLTITEATCWSSLLWKSWAWRLTSLIPVPGGRSQQSSLSLRTTWSGYWVPGLSGLCRETLFQNQNKAAITPSSAIRGWSPRHCE